MAENRRKTSEGQLALVEGMEKKKPRKAKSDSGSRWAAFILLMVTVILSLIFYFQSWLSNIELGKNDKPSGFSGSDWVFEK